MEKSITKALNIEFMGTNLSQMYSLQTYLEEKNFEVKLLTKNNSSCKPKNTRTTVYYALSTVPSQRQQVFEKGINYCTGMHFDDILCNKYGSWDTISNIVNRMEGEFSR